MKLRNFLIDVMNLTTIDVLWDVSIHVVPYLLWCIFGAYNVIIITYISVGFALLFRHQGQCEGLITWNGNSRIPRFFMPYSELICVIDFGLNKFDYMKNLVLFLTVLLFVSCGGGKSGEYGNMSEEQSSEYEEMLASLQRVEIMLDEVGEMSVDQIVALSEFVPQLYYTYDMDGLDSTALAKCHNLKKRIDFLRNKLNERLQSELATLVITSHKKQDYLMDSGVEAFPVYLEKGDKMFYRIETESPVTVKVYNADSRKLLKSYSSKTKVYDSLDIRNSAIYLLEVNPGATQYVDINVGYKVSNVSRLNNLAAVNTEIVECEKGAFRAISTKGIKMVNLFEEPRKFTLRGQIKAAFSGSYRGIVAIQVPAGTTDVLYRLRISTDEDDMYTDGKFSENMDHSYSKVKVLGMPLYESQHSIGLIQTLLGDNKPPREEDAYINMFVFNSSSQAKSFQDGKPTSSLQYNINYSTMGTQSCNGRIPMNGKQTIYLGFENERMRFHNYVWLEAIAITPKTEYFNAKYTIVK